MKTRRHSLRAALLLPVLLAGLPAAVDDNCQSVAVEDEIEGVIERRVGNERFSADVPSDATVTLLDQNAGLEIVWLEDDALVVVSVALPEDLELYAHADVDLEGSVCRCTMGVEPVCSPEDSPTSCSTLSGVLTIAHTGRLCADGACELTFELAIVGSSEDDVGVAIDLVRTAETEESECSSGCGSGGLLFI